MAETAEASAQANTAAPAAAATYFMVDTFNSGAAATAALAAASQINNCCEPCVPIAGINSRLNANAPTMEPAVLAAYTSPESSAGSSPSAAAPASANGKLAPHSSVAGKIALMQRAMSRSKLNHGLTESCGS